MSRQSAHISSKADGTSLPPKSLVGIPCENASTDPVGQHDHGHPQKNTKQSVGKVTSSAKAGHEPEHTPEPHTHQPEPEDTLLLTLLTPLTPTSNTPTADATDGHAPTPSLRQTPLLAASGSNDHQDGPPGILPCPELEAADISLPAGPLTSSGRCYGTQATNDPHPALTAGLGKCTMVEISAEARQKRAERQAVVDQQRPIIEKEKEEMERKIRALADFEQNLCDLDAHNDVLFGAEEEDKEGQDTNMEDSLDIHQMEADGNAAENTRCDNTGAWVDQGEASAAVGDGQGVQAGTKRKVAPNAARTKVS